MLFWPKLAAEIRFQPWRWTEQVLFSFLLLLGVVFTTKCESQNSLIPESSYCKDTSKFAGRVYEIAEPFQFVQSQLAIPKEITSESKLKSADFNGDGYVDILSYDIKTKVLSLFISSFGKTFIKETWKNLPNITDHNFSSIFLADFDRNFCADIAIPLDHQSWQFLLSNCKNEFTIKKVLLQVPSLHGLQGIAINSRYNRYPELMLCVYEDKTPICLRWRTTRSPDLTTYDLISGMAPNGIMFAADLLGNGEESVISQHLASLDSAGFINRHAWSMLQFPKYALFTQRFGLATVMLAPFTRPFYTTQEVSLLLDDLSFNKLLATFESKYPWSIGAVVDVNGDGRSDIMSYADSLFAWWVAFSVGTTTIEIPVIGLEKPADSLQAISAFGDFNGNGLDEVVILNKDSEFRIYEMGGVRGVSGARIIINGGQPEGGQEKIVESDTEGYFAIDCISPNSEVSFVAEKEEYSFTPANRNFSTVRNAQESVNFIATRLSGNKSIGGAVSFSKNLSGPYVCLGYNSAKNGSFSKWGSTDSAECPKNYALVSATNFSRAFPAKGKEARDMIVNGNCCRLPADDILLLDTDITVEGSCPAGYIATGTYDHYYTEGKYLLRCTAINQKRYKLSSPVAGTPVGVSSSSEYSEVNWLPDDLPMALRWGALRMSYNNWSNLGCLGLPWGSVLISKEYGSCKDLLFAQLQYAGMGDDPPAGTPVKMFPQCRSIDNIYDPRSGCRPLED